MSAHRYRFFATQHSDREWHIEADEADHVSRVLRLEAGCDVEVTDGRGRWAIGKLVNNRGKSIRVECSSAHTETPPTWRITIAVGALKPGAIDDVLPGLVELGIDRILIFQQLGAAKARLHDNAFVRWQRIIQNAVKQSKRATLPDLQIFGSLAQLLPAMSGQGLVLAPGATTALFHLVSQLDGDLGLIVGGERGLDQDELSLAKAAGYTTVALGPTILRAVTATLAAAAVTSLRRAAAPC